MPSIHAIFASTSGNTEYVVDTLISHLEKTGSGITATKQRCENAQAEDLKRGDVILLASATWNYDAVEGYLNAHMREYLEKRCGEADIEGRKMAIIALGDDRYHYTGRATERFMQFMMGHKAKPCCMPLVIINEPFGQEDKIQKWGDKLIAAIKSDSPAAK